SRRLPVGSFAVLQRQEDDEIGSSGLTLALHQPPMLADDALGNGKAESGARGPATDHGVEDVLQQLRRDARAVIDDVDPTHQPVAAMADGELPQGPAAK